MLPGMRTCEDVAWLDVTDGQALLAVQPAELMRERLDLLQSPLAVCAAFCGKDSVAQGIAHALQRPCTQGLVDEALSLSLSLRTDDGMCIVSQRYGSSHVCYTQGKPSGPARPAR